MAKPRTSKKSTPVNSEITAPVSSTAFSAPTDNGAAIEAVEPTKLTRKPSIVKSEVRPNVVPINVEDEIRRLAYILAERRGFEPGHEAEDWLTAEREIRQRYHQQSA